MRGAQGQSSNLLFGTRKSKQIATASEIAHLRSVAQREIARSLPFPALQTQVLNYLLECENFEKQGECYKASDPDKGLEIFLDQDGYIHRDNGPALVLPVENIIASINDPDAEVFEPEPEELLEEASYFSAILWRLHKYTRVNEKYVPEPELVTASFRLFHGKLHHETEASVEIGTSKQWYRMGKLHRQALPAWITDTEQGWYRNGLLHREDGPALTGPRQGFFLLGKRLDEDEFESKLKDFHRGKLI